MKKYYKISEDELVKLIATSIKMDALEGNGVDNWIGYGEGFHYMIKEFFPEAADDEIEGLYFDDCARTLLKNYSEVED